MNQFFTRARDAYRKNAQFRSTLAELNGMSELEARDLGLSRTDFRRIASEAVYGR